MLLQAINFAYTGVSEVNDDVAEIFNHNPKTIAFGSSSMSGAGINQAPRSSDYLLIATATANTFEVGDPALKHLENSTWAGNGRFLLEDGVFKVETRISKVVASTDMD